MILTDEDIRASRSGQRQGRLNLAPDDVRPVMERDYVSQTEMMRTLEALVSSVDSLKQSLNIRLPLMLAVFLALCCAIVGVIVALD